MTNTATLAVHRTTSGHLCMYLDGTRPLVSGVSRVSPDVVAHDLLEHSNGPLAIGWVEDELEAIGAVWFTRGYEGAFAEVRFPLLVTYIGEATLANRVRRGKPLRPIEPSGSEGDCPVFDELLRAHARACALLGPAAVENYYLPARRYIARGYWSAVARWNGDRHAANRQFAAISEACSAWIPMLECEELAEGSRLLLTFGGGAASLERIHP